MQHGTVNTYAPDKEYGFIQNENDESIFFHKDDFNGTEAYVGQMVSFYTEENFNNAKNENSIKAVNIKEILND